MKNILSDPWIVYHSEKEGITRKNTYHEDLVAHRSSVETGPLRAFEMNEPTRNKPLNSVTQPIQTYFGMFRKEGKIVSTSAKFPLAEKDTNKPQQDRPQINTALYRSNTLTSTHDGQSSQLTSPHRAIYLHTEGSEEESKPSKKIYSQKRIFDNNLLPATFNERLNKILENLNAKKALPVQTKQEHGITPRKEFGENFRAQSRAEYYAKSPAHKFYPEVDKENMGGNGIKGTYKASIISNPEFGSPKLASYRNAKDFMENPTLNMNPLGSGRRSGAYHSFLEQSNQQTILQRHVTSPKPGENRGIRTAVSQERELRIEPKIVKKPIFADLYSNSTKNAFEMRKERNFRFGEEGLFKNSWFSPKNRGIYNKGSSKDTGIDKRNF